MASVTAPKLPQHNRHRRRPDQAIVVATPEGKIQFADQAARRWLKQFFGRPARTGLLPRKICRWLAGQQQAQRTNRPAVAKQKNARLFLKKQDAYAESTVLLLELIREKGEERSRRYRDLTVREREVLLWLTRGKSNAEIATILGIKPATVSKHLERIYPKLGVESRSAAINVRSQMENHSACESDL